MALSLCEYDGDQTNTPYELFILDEFIVPTTVFRIRSIDSFTANLLCISILIFLYTSPLFIPFFVGIVSLTFDTQSRLLLKGSHMVGAIISLNDACGTRRMS